MLMYILLFAPLQKYSTWTVKDNQILFPSREEVIGEIPASKVGV